jgi:hypothetical protein
LRARGGGVLDPPRIVLATRNARRRRPCGGLSRQPALGAERASPIRQSPSAGAAKSAICCHGCCHKGFCRNRPVEEVLDFVGSPAGFEPATNRLTAGRQPPDEAVNIALIETACRTHVQGLLGFACGGVAPGMPLNSPLQGLDRSAPVSPRLVERTSGHASVGAGWSRCRPAAPYSRRSC